jgi:hypothetical protein
VIHLPAVGADGVEAPGAVTWILLGVLALVTVAVVGAAVVWTRRARRQDSLHPPTAEEENDPVDRRSRGLRLSAATVLAVLSGILVLALVAFMAARIGDLVA